MYPCSTRDSILQLHLVEKKVFTLAYALSDSSEIQSVSRLGENKNRDNYFTECCFAVWAPGGSITYTVIHTNNTLFITANVKLI